MKKQVKSFGEFTRRKVNEDYYYDYKPQDFESGGKFHREEEFKIGDRVYVAGLDDIPGKVVGFAKDEYGSPLVVVRIAGQEGGYRKSDVYKLDDKDLGSWSLSRPRMDEDYYYAPEEYGEYEKSSRGMATATLKKGGYVPNLAFGDMVVIEYQGREAVTMWDGNSYESWSDIFNAAEKLGADSEQVKFKQDGRTKIIGRDILDSFYRKGAEFGDVTDFDSYPNWDL